ncbi:MAG TPA: M48 family metallopeptidase [Gemmataceae bacterium]|nr:M48 family metallopeptidase [Gemmataceae bacterium]
MADLTFPYPSAPPGIPADLARLSWRYRAHALLVLLTLFVFLFVYLTLLAGTLWLLYWAVALPTGGPTARAGGWAERAFLLAFRASVGAVAAVLFGFLLKGLFERGRQDADRYLEVTEQQQPELFRFIRSLGREIGAPMPTRVYLSDEVNAAMLYGTSILNLFVPPRKDLLIGLGLVNDLDLMELKAILAHEFGHFTQRSVGLNRYVRVVYRVAGNMLYARDRWDDWVVRGLDLPWVSAFAAALGALLEGTRKALDLLFRGLGLAHASLLRQMEFNADLVAVSACGSDAPVHALLKSDFSQASAAEARQGLALAAETGLFSRDFFFHQDRAAHLLRSVHKDPQLGRPPDLAADASAPSRVFQPGGSSPAAMWADHPPHHDREENAKRIYWRSPRDERPAWLLFRDAPALREELTRRFYRHDLGLETEGPLAEPQAVQALIDEEQAAGTFAPHYRGAYDDRPLELDDLDALVSAALSRPLPPEQWVTALEGLYTEELACWVAQHQARLRDFDILDGIGAGRLEAVGGEFELRGQRHPLSQAGPLLAGMREQLGRDRLRLAKFDTSVFVLHYHLAGPLSRQEEFCQRYRFHLQVQKLLHTLWGQQAQVESVLQLLSSRKVLQWDALGGVKGALRQSREGLAAALSEAANLWPPPLKNVKANEPLGCLLPAGPSVPDLAFGELSLDVGWIQELHREISATFHRLSRILSKSLAGILALQEQLADQARRTAGTRSPAPAASSEQVNGWPERVWDDEVTQAVAQPQASVAGPSSPAHQHRADPPA